jgi:hypothetical protein
MEEVGKGREEPEPLRANIDACGRTWLETIAQLGQPRETLSRVEREMIGRAIQEHGAEAVDLALYGARFEPAVDNWNPRDHVDITRPLTKDKTGKPRIQKFMGYGAKAKAAAERRKAVQAAPGPDLDEVTDPVRVREILESAGFGMPKGAA